MDASISRLTAIGFERCGEFALDGETLSIQVHTSRSEKTLLYAFVVEEEVKYVGKTVQGLQKRLYFYCKPGPGQSTNIRANKLIRNQLLEGRKVEIFAYHDDGSLKKGEFSVNLAAGIEDQIINMLQPDWNSLKTPSNSANRKNKAHGKPTAMTQQSKSKSSTAARPHFQLRLGTAYWSQGFFNVGVDYDRYFGKHNQAIDIFLGDETEAIQGHINRTANPNGTPRIMGGAVMRNWIQRNAKLGGTIDIVILSAGEIRLKKTR